MIKNIISNFDDENADDNLINSNIRASGFQYPLIMNNLKMASVNLNKNEPDNKNEKKICSK